MGVRNTRHQDQRGTSQGNKDHPELAFLSIVISLIPPIHTRALSAWYKKTAQELMMKEKKVRIRWPERFKRSEHAILGHLS